MFSERLERAIRLSMQAHAGQVRKADPEVPYATHPVHVAFLVRAAGGDEDCVLAALLHDLLEDTEVTPEDLEEAFGAHVTSIVQEVSEDKTLPWQTRKARMVAHLQQASREACLVAAADKLHNLETLLEAHARKGATVWKAFRSGPEATLRFHEEVLGALRGRLPAGIEKELARVVGALRITLQAPPG
jgi:(p)ppGpp synthase/HD superfamily hydrolase